MNLTPQEVATKLKCSDETVYALIRKGKIKAFKLGGRRYRIRSVDLEQYECASVNTVESGQSIDQMESVIPYVLPTGK